MSLKAQKHRTFNSALTKQACLGHYIKPVYSVIGQTHAHIHNGLMRHDDYVDDADEAGTEEEAEVKLYVVVCSFSTQFFLSISSLHFQNDLFDIA